MHHNEGAYKGKVDRKRWRKVGGKLLREGEIVLRRLVHHDWQTHKSEPDPEDVIPNECNPELGSESSPHIMEHLSALHEDVANGVAKQS